MTENVPRITDRQEQVLTCLASGALHGWALNKTLGFQRGAVYEILRALQRREYVTEYDEPGHTSPRVVYAITDLGLAVSRAYDAARRAYNAT